MKTVYVKTLYQKRFMLLGWFAGIAFMSFITMSVYNSFSNGSLADSLQSLPPALKQIVGDAASFKTVGGFISQQIFELRMPLLLTILSIALLVGLSAGEEQSGLTETQLALPLSRQRLLQEKLAAAVTIIVLASLGSLVGIAAGLLTIHQGYNIRNVLPHLVSCMLVALNYGLIGFTIASTTGLKGVALGVSSGFAFLSYLVNSMASSVDYLQSVDKLTLFHYYSTTGSYNWHNLGVQLLVMAVLLTISFVRFAMRDIRAR